VRQPELIRYQGCWPRETAPEHPIQAFRLLATSAGYPVVIEAVGSTDHVDHYLAIPQGREGRVVPQLRAAVPGLSLELASKRPAFEFNRAVELRLSTKRRSLRTEDLAGVSRALLTALAHVGPHEQLVLQWILGPPLAAVAVPNRADSFMLQSWTKLFLNAPAHGPQPLDPEVRSALRDKHTEPGWKLVGRIGVKADTRSRQRQLIRQVLGALKSTQAPNVGFWVRSTDPARLEDATLPWLPPLRLNVRELAAVSAWPVGETSELPVSKVGSRLVPPSSAIARKGRIVADATFPGKARPLALMPNDALRHLHVIGPTGSGKSTLLLNLIVQDIEAGRGVVVIEPKRDLIESVLERIPAERMDDVVVISPGDREATHVVGLNPLALDGRPPELVADQLLGVFQSLFAEYKGPRTTDILGNALLTLARQPGATLVALPLLLSDSGYRRRVLAKVDDPVGLEPFWAEFDAWSDSQRAENVAPALRRIRPFLMRPDVRTIVGQPKPHFQIRQVFTARKILLVDLSKGSLGPETAALLGGLVITQLWQATLGRATIEPNKRHPVFVYADEYQEYLKLPTDLADALAQARGLGVGFVLAHQYMHQLDPAMRSAVLANVQSRIAFRLSNDDARIMAAGSSLAPEDFQSLGAYQCYVQLVAGGSLQPWCSARSLLPALATSDPAAIRTASTSRYGLERSEVEADIRRLVRGTRDGAVGVIGARRLGSGGPS
jgi:hypothetical protein